MIRIEEAASLYRNVFRVTRRTYKVPSCAEQVQDLSLECHNTVQCACEIGSAGKEQDGHVHDRHDGILSDTSLGMWCLTGGFCIL